eukprot:TRINITY_DN7101_c0_g2_i3.p1 TRINITY_DN7101_c0_g2~~TRINITY_DN7101_c0_g2_i3.p1  ORF type:complete len:104 (+),score=17.18 TRINITY_DN7101_c0_g2_i3:154-465(+)
MGTGLSSLVLKLGFHKSASSRDVSSGACLRTSPTNLNISNSDIFPSDHSSGLQSPVATFKVFLSVSLASFTLSSFGRDWTSCGSTPGKAASINEHRTSPSDQY